jgi:murein tripeptide amidase MpaA
MYVLSTARLPWLAMSLALVATIAGPWRDAGDAEPRTPSQLAMVLAERVRLAGRASAEWFAEYRDNDEVNAYLARLAAGYPDLARVWLLGRSVEGRPIRAIEITNGGTLGIAIDGGQPPGSGSR